MFKILLPSATRSLENLEILIILSNIVAICTVAIFKNVFCIIFDVTFYCEVITLLLMTTVFGMDQLMVHEFIFDHVFFITLF